MSFDTRLFFLGALLSVLIGGCSLLVDFDRSLLVDAGVDAGVDAAVDASIDVGEDAAVDAN